MANNHEIKIKTYSPEQTEQVGEAIGNWLEAGDVLTLDGDLGAGKTCLTRGIARGAKFAGRVTSPTFTIVNEYVGGRIKLFHFDTYRLEGVDDFYASGLDEYFDDDGASIIEWSSIIEEALPADAFRAGIFGVGDERELKIELPSSANKHILARFEKLSATLSKLSFGAGGDL